MINEITGIILCGGRSTRMQSNKGLLKIGGQTIIEIIVSKLKSVFSNVIISANSTNEFAFLNLPIVSDVFANKGPLAGIHASLKLSNTERNFIISCDMPLISEQMINFITNYHSDKEILLPKAYGTVQQLCGVYSKSVVNKIEKILILAESDNSVKGSVFELLARASTEFVVVEGQPYYDKNTFLNMNTPEDYELIKIYYQM